MEEAFERDRNNLKAKEEQGSKNAAKEKDFEREIVMKLVKTEHGLNKSLENKEA